MITLTIETRAHTELRDITGEVAGALHQSGVLNGVCHIFVPHTSAAITLNENWDPSVRTDILNVLDQLVPASGRYRHAEGNAPAHIKASLMGSSQTVLVEGGRLVFGSWQGIFLTEFDGPRRRRVLVKVLPDAAS